jgi:hypothetical protein
VLEKALYLGNDQLGAVVRLEDRKDQVRDEDGAEDGHNGGRHGVGAKLGDAGPAGKLVCGHHVVPARMLKQVDMDFLEWASGLRAPLEWLMGLRGQDLLTRAAALDGMGHVAGNGGPPDGEASPLEGLGDAQVGSMELHEAGRASLMIVLALSSCPESLTIMVVVRRSGPRIHHRPGVIVGCLCLALQGGHCCKGCPW